MIEIRVIGDTVEEVLKGVAELAEKVGVVPEGLPTLGVTDDGKEEAVIVGQTAKKRGRPSKAEKAAEALVAEQAPVGEIVDEDPFGVDEPAEEVDLEKVKVTTLERLQRLYASKGGVDTGNSLLAKHGKGEKKFGKLPLEVFPAIAKDLDTLGAE